MPYDFNPEYSTNSIWRNEDMSRCLTADLDNMDAILSSLQSGKANATHTHSEYAEVNHTHDGYAEANHIHDGYAEIDHVHDGYAEADHTHSQYALATDVSDLEDKVGDTTVASQISTAIASKADANHSHTEYAEVDHSHSGYALESHEHTGYAEVSHGHSEYANADHAHTDYAASTHTHTEYAASNHAHSYNDLSDLPTIPTALPANGGNADTVDGKHASEFALATDVAALQTLVGDTGVAEQISTAVASKANVAHTHAIADIANLSTELDSKYEKPSTGISKTDLASDVQASLGKADTAVQSLSGYATESYVDAKVAGLVDTAPEALNTLNELAAALGDDPNFSATVATQIGGKVDKVTGKELSSNDYTDAEKTKLAGIETGANKTVVDSALSSTSTNPVQNKVINAAISNLNTLVGDTAVSSQISTAIANKVDKVSGKGLSTNDYTTAEKNKLAGIAAGAEVNQNAFSNVVVGSTTISADAKTDTLTFVAGSNITLTPDATNDKITIAATNTVYTHPTYTAKNSGLYKVAIDGTGHVSGTTAVAKSDITALGIPAQDTTYSAATTSTAGLMSASDKSKLDGIATGANKITVDSALSSTSTNPVQNKVINSAISNLNALVGDTAVSTQISNAIANKANASHTHSAATTSAAGFMSASDKSKLDGIAAGANAYTLPAATSSALGGVKVGSNITNSSGTISLTKANVTSALGYTPPTTNTTYSAATTSAAGLMSAADKVKLDGIATGANKITVDSALSSSSTNPVQNKVVNSAISNLNTLFAKLSNPNLLINGDFQVWQRGQSFSNIENCYVADRWLIKNAKAKTSAVVKSTDVPSGQPMAQSIKLTETTEENSYLRYCFDGALKGTYTVSFWYKTSAAFNSFIYDNGSWVHLGKLTTLNSWQKATFTFTATSATYLSVIHAMSIGTTYITGVKLEYGSIATPFIPRLYVEELAMCQRYFFRLQSAYPFTMTQRASANTYSLMSIPLPVPLRGQPTIKFSNVSLLKNGTDGTSVSVTGVTCAGYSQMGVTLRMVIGSNYEAGTPYFLALPNSGYIDFDAEIY